MTPRPTRHPSHRSSHRRPRALAALACAGVLAGCAQLPTASAPAPTGREPLVVQPAQAGRVVEAATAVLQAASDPATADPAALAARVSGPELDLRTAAHTIAAAGADPAPTGGADDLTAITSILPRDGDFPRWFATVTAPGPDQAPSLVVLRAADARSPYTVWATPTLLPGASLPTLAAPADGVAVVEPEEDTNLPASPAAIATRYGDVLTEGTTSASAGDFAPDAYRAGVETATAAEVASLQAAGGTFTQERSVLPGSVLAVRTRDGGALVVAAYTWSTTSAGPAGGRPGELDPALAALAGTDEALEATVTRQEVVVFSVPPGASGGGGDPEQVQVVAAQSGPVQVATG
ncbi:hypothetical protein AB2L27_16330 [Kineococcus sp. LSe6-4]|uniref:DUF8094 domain-containing protein n=1 Tax=Kineococcus halophytocola TaxID=3234027 RepID=A0ABV4H4X7_9ACTN